MDKFLNKIIQADCLDIMREMPSESVDLIVTDPPYGLSKSESDQEIVDKAFRTFANLVFPNFNEGDIQIAQYSDLVRILFQSSDLRRFKGSTVGIESWVGVPESTINLNYDIKVREVEITTSNISARDRIADQKLGDKFNVMEPEFVGNFILDLGDAPNFPGSDILGCDFSELSLGCFGMLIRAISTTHLPNLECPDPSVFFGENFVKDIRLCNDSGGDSKSPRSILTRWRTKGNFILRFDLGRGACELLTANPTNNIDLLAQKPGPALVRTFAGASCLSSMFKSTRVSFVFSVADRTYSFYFHLWLPPKFLSIITQLTKERKGFMGEAWDGQVPSTEVWKECLRILKPGAWAFVMSIPRQDCQAKMILNLQEAGFDITYSPIMWCYGTGLPKSQNVSKILDRRLGVERKVVAINEQDKRPNAVQAHTEGQSGNFGLKGEGTGVTTKPATPESEALEGSYSGLQMKPAYELVLCVQKPFTDKHKRSDVYRMLGGKYDYWYTQRTVVKEPDEHSKGNIEKLTEKWQEELETIDYALKDKDVIERRLALAPEHIDEVLINRDQDLKLWSKPYKDTDITSSVTHALATGKGISWLDFRRIPIEDVDDIHDKNPHTVGYIGKHGIYGKSEPIEYQVPTGRFAPNLLVSDDVLSTGEITKSGVTIQPVFESHNVQGFQPNPRAIPGYNQHADSGGFSRYFSLDAWAKKYLPENIDKTFPFLITPKPSPFEKNAGLDELPDKQMYKCDNSGNSLEIFGTTDGGRKPRKNTHISVKPIKLFAYLLSIGSREGDFVYDPYMGSGTLGCTAAILKRNYGGAELDPEYCDIGRRRIAYWKDNPHKLTTKKRQKKQSKADELTLF